MGQRGPKGHYAKAGLGHAQELFCLSPVTRLLVGIGLPRTDMIAFTGGSPHFLEMGQGGFRIICLQGQYPSCPVQLGGVEAFGLLLH